MNATPGVQAAGVRPATFAWSVRKWLLIAVSVILLIVGAVLMLAVGLATLFRARRFYSEVMAASLGRALLFLWGIRIVVHAPQPMPRTQVVYISNHSSTIDMFVLISLALPNTRFFLSGFLRAVLPFGVIGYLIGIFWTVPQTNPEKRTRIFKSALRTLQRTGESVYLSPEGGRIASGAIGHFNKGAFHLATELGARIVPFYILIPAASDPGRGLDIRPGAVHVHFKPPIPTSHWQVAAVERNRDQIRECFVRWHEELKPP